jgi:hypothetical protein
VQSSAMALHMQTAAVFADAAATQHLYLIFNHDHIGFITSTLNFSDTVPRAHIIITLNKAAWGAQV